MTKKTRILSTVFAAALCVSLLLASCGKSKNDVRLGTAGIGGNYYSFGQAFSQYLMEDIDGLTVEVKVTAGSAANLRLLTDKGKYIQLAIAQADVISDQVQSSDGKPGYGAVAGLYTEACQVVTKADSGISSVRDLRGRKVSVGEEESGSEKNARQILQAYGLSEDMVEAKNMTYAEAADALSSGEIDAFFCTVGVQTTIVEELARKTPIALLDVTGAEAEALIDTYPYYVAYTIPAGTYTGQSGDVQTLGVKSILIASDDLSEDMVNKITACLFSHEQDLQYSVSVDFELGMEEATRDIPVSFHAGAKSYYKENGLAVE